MHTTPRDESEIVRLQAHPGQTAVLTLGHQVAVLRDGTTAERVGSE